MHMVRGKIGLIFAYYAFLQRDALAIENALESQRTGKSEKNTLYRDPSNSPL